MTEEKRDEFPYYTGMYTHRDQPGGYSLTVPTDWHQHTMKKKHHGMLFSPYPDDINTCILAEKHKLKYKVTVDDLVTSRDGFEKGIKDLPGVEIESLEESLSDMVNVFEARFTFLDDGVRRKRWVKNIYWGEGQLVLIAQGRTVEDFDYWLPMFYNTMMTAQVL